MRIYLIRHGDRYKHPLRPDKDEHLTLTGEEQLKSLATKFDYKRVPTIFITSKHRHAVESAEILQKMTNPMAPLVSLEALTPIPTTFALRDIISEVRRVGGHDLSDHEIIAMVLHHPRQTQLAMMLKGDNYEEYKSQPEPKNGEAICLVATTLDAFARGEGMEESRI